MTIEPQPPAGSGHQLPARVCVLIADDHAIVRDGLRRIIEAEPGLCVIGQAVDGVSTLARLHDTAVDLLLLDLTMPPPAGPELIQQIRRTWPDLPILVLSMHNHEAIARAALQAGASGYLAKDNDPEVLVQAVREVAAGGLFVDARLAKALIFLSAAETSKNLTPREVQIMLRLCKGQSNAAIARVLMLSEKTVSTHKTNLMAKLRIRSVAELVRHVDGQRDLGFSLPDAPEPGPRR